MARILPSDGRVEMVVTPNGSQVLFHTEQVDLVSRLIEGTFPNFRAIIPLDYTTRAVLEVPEWRSAMKSVTPFARDSSNITRIKVDRINEDGILAIEATTEDVGGTTTTISASVEGPAQQGIWWMF